MFQNPTVVKKVWGIEEIFANTPEYCGKLMKLYKQHQCSLHHHEKKDETFYIYSGIMFLQAGSLSMFLHPGHAYRIPRKTPHTFAGIEETIFIEASTHDDPSDSYRAEGRESRKIPDNEFQALLKDFQTDNKMRRHI